MNEKKPGIRIFGKDMIHIDLHRTIPEELIIDCCFPKCKKETYYSAQDDQSKFVQYYCKTHGELVDPDIQAYYAAINFYNL